MREKLRPVATETYNLWKLLIKRQYVVPVKERTKEEKSAVVKFWRHKHGLQLKTVDGNEVLFYEGKKVVTSTEFNKVIKNEFKTSKGSGPRTLCHSMKSKYTGINERRVRKWLHKDKMHSHMNAQFLNKPPLRTIHASYVFQRVQIDLIDMRSDIVPAGKYILTFLDVFSRFVILRPLKDKSVASVKHAVKNICMEHGFPNIIQCDNGPEFRGTFPAFLAKRGVKLIHSRPYHPQSQGKVESMNKLVKRKIRFCSLKDKGFNWANQIRSISKALNDDPKVTLGYQTPFSVYFGRGAKGTSADKIRRKAEQASVKCELQMKTSYRKRTCCSIYKQGEKVLMKYPPLKHRVPRKRAVVKASIMKRNKTYSRYEVSYSINKKMVTQWVSVEFITSRTLKQEIIRQKKSKVMFEKIKKRQAHRDKYYIPLDNDLSDDPYSSQESEFVTDRRYFSGNNKIIILHDPTNYGNCQFDAVADQLSKVGIYRNGIDIRKLAVEHINLNSIFYVDFIDIDASINDYVKRMSNHRTYGDHLTLVAICRELNCQFLVINADSDEHNLISNTNVFDGDLPVYILGYYPEERGEHYVSLTVDDPILFNSLLDSISRRLDSTVDHPSVDCVDANDITVGDRAVSATRADEISDTVIHRTDDLEYLPREMQRLIILYAMNLDPSCRYHLKQVNSFFKATVNSQRNPRIYISPSILQHPPSPLSVRRLISACGRGSGLGIAIRGIINNSQWYNAWLFLENLENRWFSVQHIIWRQWKR